MIVPVMAGQIWTRCRPDPRVNCQRVPDTIFRRFFDTIGAAFWARSTAPPTPGRERPFTGGGRAKRTATGVAHALVSVNHDPGAPSRGGRERRPFWNVCSSA